jgi:hypothetical protein
LCTVLWLVWSGFPVVLFVAVPIGGSVGISSTMALRMTPNGVSVAKRFAPWGDLELRGTRWGESLTTSAEAPRSDRVSVYLPMYQRRWRSGNVGSCVHSSAPGLLDEEDPS